MAAASPSSARESVAGSVEVDGFRVRVTDWMPIVAYELDFFAYPPYRDLSGAPGQNFQRHLWCSQGHSSTEPAPLRDGQPASGWGRASRGLPDDNIPTVSTYQHL